MKTRSHAEVGQKRREQIIEAAIAIIAEQGLQNLSLSEIEGRAEMSRGQLTYYFPAKEEILLAVFDRLLQLMRQQVTGEVDPPKEPAERGWERMRDILSVVLVMPPDSPEFHSLQYTFLSQIAHREDYRRHLAGLYEEWRREIAVDIDAEMTRRPAAGRASARTVATLIEAILHGLAMQRNADPNSYDRQEMLELCLDLLGNYLRSPASAEPGSTTNGHARAPGATPRSSRASKVKHE